LPQFKTHTLDTAPEASRALLQGLQQQAGFIPNLAATMATSPVLLEAFLTIRAQAARTSLDAAARELMAVAVAMETGCTYCAAAHSTFGVLSGAAAADLEAVRGGGAPADPRLGALVRFARAVARHDHTVPDRAQDLLGAGLSADQVLEALVVIAVPLLAGSAFHLTRVALDAAFQPQAWAPAPAAATRR
jgi:uncharacterized peroxidase-related enzyme